MNESMDATVQIACPQCLTANRVPGARLAEAPKCGKCGSLLLDPHPLELQESSFQAFLERTELPVVVDFWASWCAPCRAMAPQFEKAAERLATSVRFAKVDTEQNRSLSTRLAIHSIPTLVLFRDGREVDRVSGAMDATTIARWLSERSA